MLTGTACTSFARRFMPERRSDPNRLISARPAPVRTDGSNAFARHSMAVRVPHILGDTLERHPDYALAIKDALRRLSDQIADDAPLRGVDAPAPDYDAWARRFAPHEGETWLGTGWFFSEMLAYRLALRAVRYWTTRRDPFRPFKQEELESEALWEGLEASLGATGLSEERLSERLTRALWGNRMDRSIAQAFAQGTEAQDSHLLANDIPDATAHVLSAAPGTVHLIMDNAGTELALDLAVADLLLEADLARAVVLHVKMQPVLVSDALGEDVLWMLGVMEGRSKAASAMARRLRRAMQTGRLRVVPDFFWSTDGGLWELPPRLQAAFRGARLVIAKGDANYRRATNDALWPPGTTLAEAVGDFPAPLLALRTIKSDTLVGVPPETTARLDAQEDAWRTRGTYGVAQLAVGGRNAPLL